MKNMLSIWRFCWRKSWEFSLSSLCIASIVSFRISQNHALKIVYSKTAKGSRCLSFTLSSLWLNVQYFRITFRALKLYRCHSALVCRSILQFLLLLSSLSLSFPCWCWCAIHKKNILYIFLPLVKTHDTQKNELERNVLLKLLFVCLFSFRLPSFVHRAPRSVIVIALLSPSSSFMPLWCCFSFFTHTQPRTEWKNVEKNLNEAKFEY